VTRLGAAWRSADYVSVFALLSGGRISSNRTIYQTSAMYGHPKNSRCCWQRPDRERLRLTFEIPFACRHSAVQARWAHRFQLHAHQVRRMPAYTASKIRQVWIRTSDTGHLPVRTVRVRSANPIAPEKAFPIRPHPLLGHQRSAWLRPALDLQLLGGAASLGGAVRLGGRPTELTRQCMSPAASAVLS